MMHRSNRARVLCACTSFPFPCASALLRMPPIRLTSHPAKTRRLCIVLSHRDCGIHTFIPATSFLALAGIFHLAYLVCRLKPVCQEALATAQRLKRVGYPCRTCKEAEPCWLHPDYSRGCSVPHPLSIP